MNVGEAARRTRLPAKTIRYYDDIELVRPARSPGGYRVYSEADVFRLRFVKRARGLGFSIEDCRLLLSLHDKEKRTSREVKAMVTLRLDEVERRLVALGSIRDTLRTLGDRCAGDERPECPILDELASPLDGPLDGLDTDASPSTRHDAF